MERWRQREAGGAANGPDGPAGERAGTLGSVARVELVGPQVLADDPAQSLLKRVVGAAAYVLPQDRVDQDQVVALPASSTCWRNHSMSSSSRVSVIGVWPGAAGGATAPRVPSPKS